MGGFDRTDHRGQRSVRRSRSRVCRASVTKRTIHDRDPMRHHFPRVYDVDMRFTKTEFEKLDMVDRACLFYMGWTGEAEATHQRKVDRERRQRILARFGLRR